MEDVLKFQITLKEFLITTPLRKCATSKQNLPIGDFYPTASMPLHNRTFGV